MMTAVPTEEWQPTEWFDVGEPEDLGIRLDHEDIGLPWSNITPGKTRVRFKTMTTMRRGTVISVKKRSMLVRFDGFDKDTAIPDAKWYWCQARMGNINEHLVAINTPPLAPHRLSRRRPDEQEYPEGGTVTPAEAANILGTDPKNIRRMIRNGKLRALRDGGRWVIPRTELAK